MKCVRGILELGLAALLLTFAPPLALADQAGDTTIAVKFENIDFSSSLTAGVTAVQSTNWNLVTDTTSGTGSVSSLNQDVSGSATSVPVSLSWSAPEVVSSFSTPFGDGRSFQTPVANARLMYGGLGSGGSSASLTLSGLSSTYSSGFSLYIYTAYTGANSRSGSFTVDGSTVGNLNSNINTPPNAWVQSTSNSTAGDYMLFTGLTGTSLTMSWTGPIDNELQGIELVANGGSTAVPEPSTYALLLGGFVLLLGVARRRGTGVRA